MAQKKKQFYKSLVLSFCRQHPLSSKGQNQAPEGWWWCWRDVVSSIIQTTSSRKLPNLTDNSWRAPYLPSELRGGPSLSRESTRLSQCIFVFPSKWCSFIISLFLLACFPHSLLLLSSHISQKSFPITPTLSRPLPFTLYTSSHL